LLLSPKRVITWAGSYLCLLGLLVLALAGPLHSHQDQLQSHADCALCHAGDHASITSSAADPGKPCQVNPGELVYFPNTLAARKSASAVQSSRAPPVRLLA
jgi:hypothetical protein